MHSIVPLKDSDAFEMAEIHNMCIPYQPWPVNTFKDFLTNDQWGRVQGFGVRGNNQLQGYVLIRDLVDYAEILDFAIMPLLQRQGLGTALLRHFIKTIATRPILLEMKFNNQSAQNLYERFDFQIVRTIPNYYKGQNYSFNAVLMRLC